MALRKEVNLARSNKFTYNIAELPILNALTQSIDMDPIQFNEVQVFNPVLDLKVHGEKIEYSSLDVSFVVDENFDVYAELYNFVNVATGPYSIPEYRKENYTDIVISIWDNGFSKIVRKFIFEDCFITSIGNISFDSIGSDSIISNATFSYQSLKIDPFTTDTTGFVKPGTHSKTENYPPDPFKK